LPFVTTHALAPSDNWLALPAVMTPPSTTGASALSDSSVDVLKPA
jgi:hypothetical protein